MTEKAFKGYQKIKMVIANTLKEYEHFYFKTKEDAERYLDFGIDPRRITIAGDMKFDAPLMERDEQVINEIRENLGVTENNFVFVAGSTRPGEEEKLAGIYGELKEKIPEAVMVVAPRHIERLDEVRGIFQQKGIVFKDYGEKNKEAGVILIDRLGILTKLYLCASVSFVGGTLVDIGGHNILEPVWAGSPVIFGNSVFNVVEAADYIVGHNYGAMIKSEKELLSLLIKIHSGDILYHTKQKNETDNSPTVKIGEYILSKIDNA